MEFYDIALYIFTEGFGWTPAQIELLDASPLTLDIYQIELLMDLTPSLANLFIRESVANNKMFDVILFSGENSDFQTLPLSMAFDNVAYNWFASGENKAVSLHLFSHIFSL